MCFVLSSKSQTVCGKGALMKYHVEAGNVEPASQTKTKANPARHRDRAGPAYLRGALRSLHPAHYPHARVRRGRSRAPGNSDVAFLLREAAAASVQSGG